MRVVVLVLLISACLVSSAFGSDDRSLNTFQIDTKVYNYTSTFGYEEIETSIIYGDDEYMGYLSINLEEGSIVLYEEDRNHTIIFDEMWKGITDVKGVYSEDDNLRNTGAFAFMTDDKLAFVFIDDKNMSVKIVKTASEGDSLNSASYMEMTINHNKTMLFLAVTFLHEQISKICKHELGTLEIVCRRDFEFNFPHSLLVDTEDYLYSGFDDLNSSFVISKLNFEWDIKWSILVQPKDKTDTRINFKFSSILNEDETFLYNLVLADSKLYFFLQDTEYGLIDLNTYILSSSCESLGNLKIFNGIIYFDVTCGKNVIVMLNPDKNVICINELPLSEYDMMGFSQLKDLNRIQIHYKMNNLSYSLTTHSEYLYIHPNISVSDISMDLTDRLDLLNVTWAPPKKKTEYETIQLVRDDDSISRTAGSNSKIEETQIFNDSFYLSNKRSILGPLEANTDYISMIDVSRNTNSEENPILYYMTEINGQDIPSWIKFYKANCVLHIVTPFVTTNHISYQLAIEVSNTQGYVISRYYVDFEVIGCHVEGCKSCKVGDPYTCQQPVEDDQQTCSSDQVQDELDECNVEFCENCHPNLPNDCAKCIEGYEINKGSCLSNPLIHTEL